MPCNDHRRLQLLDSLQRLQPDLPVRRGAGIQVGQVFTDQAVAGEHDAVLRKPHREVRGSMSRSEQNSGFAAAEIERGVGLDLPVRV